MKSKTLKDLCFQERCGVYGIPAVAEDYNLGKTRYLRITDISEDGKLLNENPKSVSADDIGKYILEEGDIVFARTGNSTGKAYYHEDINGKLAFAGFLIKFSLNPKLVNPKYLRYYTITEHYKQWVENFSLGSTRGNINAQSFGLCPIPLPERKQQDLLVKVLSNLDQKIELNNQINAELEELAKLVYDYWFVQFDFPDETGKPYKASGGKMVYNEVLKTEVPEGWVVETMKKALDVQYGYPFSTQLFSKDIDEKAVIRIRDILKNTISTYSSEEVDEKYRLNKKDLVIGMDGNFHMNFWNDNNSWLNQRCVRVREKQKSKISVYQAFQNIEPYIKAREKNVSRTTVGHLSARDISGLKVLIAPENKNFQHINFFSSIVEKIIAHRIENKKLSSLRDWLLPMLMNGQVSVGKGYDESEVALGMVAEKEEEYI